MVKVSSQSALAVLLGLASRVHACSIPSVNGASLDLVAEFEGFVPNIYQDPNGADTVGYGHLCQQAGCAEVPYPIPLSVDDGKALLLSDLGNAESCMVYATGQNVYLNANQYGALVSWAFNVGCGNVRSSDLIKGLNAGDDVNAIASQELPQWVHGDGGVVLPGLVRRRQAELDLLRTPTGDGALPAPDC